MAMKFNIKTQCNAARLGLITSDNITKYNVETPNLFLYTKGGTIPDITPDVLQQITKDSVPLHFPIPNIMHFHERMKMYQGSIADFTGFKGHMTYASIIDPGRERVKGYHKTNILSVWGTYGREEINSETYMDFIEALKPDLFLTLCDGDTDSNSSKRRVEKSYTRSLEFFEQCMNLYKKSEILKSSKILGPLEGGFNVEAREKCSSVMGAAPVFGVVVDGLYDNNEEEFESHIKKLRPMVEASLKHIPDDKLRICHGSWSPAMVLALISLGIDIIDTSYPYIIAQKGGALVFPNDESLLKDPVNGSSVVVANGHHPDTCQSDEWNNLEEPANKRPKVKSDADVSPMYISLHSTLYADNFEPISKSCECLTCKNHTNAYIHHLLNVKELLGHVLLMIHNLHHYFLFFETIRKSLKTGKLHIMRHQFEKFHFENSVEKETGIS